MSQLKNGIQEIAHFVAKSGVPPESDIVQNMIDAVVAREVVTWEQLVEHCRQNYETFALSEDGDIELEYAQTSFGKDGWTHIGASIKSQTLILWGRYLEGLGHG